MGAAKTKRRLSQTGGLRKYDINLINRQDNSTIKIKSSQVKFKLNVDLNFLKLKLIVFNLIRNETNLQNATLHSRQKQSKRHQNKKVISQKVNSNKTKSKKLVQLKPVQLKPVQ